MLAWEQTEYLVHGNYWSVENRLISQNLHTGGHWYQYLTWMFVLTNQYIARKTNLKSTNPSKVI